MIGTLSFNRLKKNLQKNTDYLKKQKLAVLSDTASQLTVQAIKGYAIEEGIAFDVYEADYNSIDAEVFNETSSLYQFAPAFVFINLGTEHLLKKFYAANRENRKDFASEEVAYISSLYTAIVAKCSAKVIVSNFIEINDNVFGNYANKERTSFLYQLRKLNVLLMDTAQQNTELFLCDLLSIQSQIGYNAVFDPKMYINADMVYSLEFLPLLAKSVTDIILAVTGIFKKCVVLDLDNTLWGGIIGDDGIEGIQVGSLGLGKAFSEFQSWLKELKHRGIILAVCSKNTASVAKEPFTDHPDMVLRLDDIALFVANWENKVDNIRYIQSVLNISFDSMVFLDDNAFEREMVKSGIPQLTVPDMPEDPSEYLLYLRSLNLFETASFTAEDKDRTRQYQEEAGRTVLQKSFATEEEFLQNLQMQSEVKPFNKFIVPRIAQLSQRSNQFNLRTIRYTEAEILSISESPAYFTLSFTLEDKFGKHGLISAIILKATDKENLFIDTWIMSCRVLKRGMENFVLNCIAELAQKNNFSTITGEYIPTRKNELVKDHYAGLHFSSFGNGTWQLKISSFAPGKTFINILSPITSLI